MSFSALDWLGEYAAPIMESVVAYERNVMNAKKQERMALLNCLLYGTGFLKHGYNCEFGIDPAWEDDSTKIRKRIKEYDVAYSTVNDSQVQTGVWTEHNPNFYQGHPWVKSVHPNDIIVDPDAISLDEARWITHRFSRPWIDVVRDMRYREKFRNVIQPTGRSEFFADADVPGVSNWKESPEFSDAQVVSLYEIFDRDTLTVKTIAPACEEVAEYKPYPFFGKEGPYVDLQFYPLDDTYWAMSHSDAVSPLAETLNKLRSQMMNHLQRHGATRLVYSKGSIDKNDIKRIFEAVDGEAVEVQNLRDDIRKVLMALPYTPITGDAWNLQTLFMGDFERAAGTDSMSMGTQQASTTATVGSYIAQQTSLRAEDMTEQLDDFLTRSTRKVIEILRQFWGEERVVPITGPEGSIWSMIKVPQNVVSAAFSVAIEPGSTAKTDRNIRVRQVIDAMQQLLPMEPQLNAKGYTLNAPELAKHFIKETGLAKNPDRFITLLPQQPMMPAETPPSVASASSAVGVEGSQQPNMNQMGQMPTETDAGQSGRMFSEAQPGV